HVALARSRDPRQNAPVPREVVLLLPPSPEPPATAQPALLAAAAGALGCAPDALTEARLRRFSFDARPRERRWRLVGDVWMRGGRPAGGGARAAGGRRLEGRRGASAGPRDVAAHVPRRSSRCATRGGGR